MVIKMAGRKKMDELTKARNAAGRAYKRKTELALKTDLDLLENRTEFPKSKKLAGRPPVPIKEQRRRAEKAWIDALARVREIEAKEGVEPINEILITSLGSVTSGRKKASSDVERLKKLIRRHNLYIKKLKEEIEQGLPESIDTHIRGRRAQTRQEKINKFESKIAEAINQISDLEKEKTPIDLAFMKLHETRVELRQLTMFVNNPTNKQVKNIPLTQVEALERIDFLEKLKDVQHTAWLSLKHEDNKKEAEQEMLKKIKMDAFNKMNAELTARREHRAKIIKRLQEELEENQKMEAEIEETLRLAFG